MEMQWKAAKNSMDWWGYLQQVRHEDIWRCSQNSCILRTFNVGHNLFFPFSRPRCPSNLRTMLNQTLPHKKQKNFTAASLKPQWLLFIWTEIFNLNCLYFCNGQYPANVRGRNGNQWKFMLLELGHCENCNKCITTGTCYAENIVFQST